MERTLTQEERIRRAEEIYLRRKNARPQYRDTTTISHNAQIPTGRNIKLFKKMALQIVICLLLYCIFYLIYDTNYSFSGTTLDTTQKILNYDINFDTIYRFISDNIFSFIKEKQSMPVEENEINEENNASEIITDNSVSNSDEIIVPEQTGQQDVNSQETQQTSAEEPDLKKLYSLIVPVSGGHITSEFGPREATSEVVSTNHKGIDIGVVERNEHCICYGWYCSCVH